MKIGQFRVAEFTAINEGLNRVRLEGGFPDAVTSFVLQTREIFSVGDTLTIESTQAPKPAVRVAPKTDPKPAAKAEFVAARTENKSDAVN